MRKWSLVCLVLLLGTGLVFSQTTTTGSGSAATPTQQHPDVPPSQPVDQTNQNNPVPTPPDSSQQQNQPESGQPSAQSASANDIPAGTEIKATLDLALSTKTSHPGDQFTATIAQPVRDTNGVTVVPAGAKIHGEITEAEQGKALPELRGKGNMRFRSIELSNGATVPLSATRFR